MNIDEIKFQTYSWGYGTTSFRVSELKYKIEKQLILLKDLRDKYPKESWRDLQYIYFELLVENGLAKPTANNKEKDARQKTSSLKDLGLIDEEGNLTHIGKQLYLINKKKEFKSKNIFYIREDAYLYFKQFLKIEFSKYSNSRSYKEFNINPFISLIYSILKLDFLTIDEFKYRLPLCLNHQDVINEVKSISKNRTFDIDYYLKEKISKKDNYKLALKYFLENDVDLENLKIIVFDRKSSKSIKIYLKLYNELLYFYENRENLSLKEKQKVFSNVKKILSDFKSSKLKPYLNKKLKLSKLERFEKLSIFRESSFKEAFFYLIHTTKWHINLDEYFDLNKRFLSLSEVFIFEENQIFLDDIIKLYFEDIIDSFLDKTTNSKKEYIKTLYNDFKLPIDKEKFQNKIENKFGIKGDLRKSIIEIKNNYKIKRFEQLIEKEFSNNILIDILQKIKDRKDTELKQLKKWDCDIPTMFEYIIGIIWYKLSDHRANPNDFLNLKLNNDLYPIRFASGGHSDIIFEYENEHLMIEVTLSNRDTQRKMELEPVSRHLGKYLLKGNSAYALFIAPYLDPNVLVAFRAYANLKYYDSKETSKFVKNLYIVPLSIDDIICLIKKNIDYNKFLYLKNKWVQSNCQDGYIWYKNEISKDINCN